MKQATEPLSKNRRRKRKTDSHWETSTSYPQASFCRQREHILTTQLESNTIKVKTAVSVRIDYSTIRPLKKEQPTTQRLCRKSNQLTDQVRRETRLLKRQNDKTIIAEGSFN